MRILSCLIVAAALAACTADAVDRQPAEAAVQRFHQQLDAGQAAAIWDAASPEFRAGVPRATFVAQLAAIHARLGATAQATQRHWKVDIGKTDTARVRLDYATRFAAGDADERFEFLLRGDRATLDRYAIASPAITIAGAPSAPSAPAP